MTGLTWDDRDYTDDMGAEVNISPEIEYFYTYAKNGVPFSRENAEGTALAKFIHTPLPIQNVTNTAYQCQRHQLRQPNYQVCQPKHQVRQPKHQVCQPKPMYANQNTKFTNQNSKYANQNTKYTNQITITPMDNLASGQYI